MFYSRLLSLCSERNIKITNLIKELHVSNGNLSKWKSGGSPKGETLIKVADHFQVSIDYLLGRTNVKEMARSKTGPLSAIEQELLDVFRLLSDAPQQQVIGFAKGFFSAYQAQVSATSPKKEAV